jgi:hypothetical protein
MKVLRQQALDRGDHYPQPAKWTYGQPDTIAALRAENYDLLELTDTDVVVPVCQFLASHKQHCPPQIHLPLGFPEKDAAKLMKKLPQVQFDREETLS